MKEKRQPLLIVFTDEVGGTTRDTQINDLKTFTQCRVEQFSAVIKNMENPNWLVIKNVGDQLVIRFKPDSELSSSVSACVKCLYDAWININKTIKENYCKIRIAVHLAYNGFATGEDLADFRVNIETEVGNANVKLNDLWPSLQYIGDDIFGYEMTRAARLISLPSKGAFILSHEVFNEMNSEMKEYCNLKGPIPLIFLKGFDDLIDIGESYIIWEANEPSIKDNIDSLFIQSKNFHTIRFIGIRCDYNDVKSSYDETYINVMKPEIYERLFMNKAINHYTDIAFNIEKEWSGHSMSLSRIFNNKKLKFRLVKDVDKRNNIDWRSMAKKMILFTSSFDLKTDDIIRNYFSEEFKGWNMIPLTLFIHENSRFKKSIWWENYSASKIGELDIPTYVLENERYYLLFFQITKDHLSKADKPDVFFETANESISIQPGKNMRIHSYGLIKGEIDGYILLGVSANESDHINTSDEELEQEYRFDDKEINSTDVIDRVVFKYLKLNCKPHPGDPTFWPRIAPINLFSLTLEDLNPHWIEIGRALNSDET